MAHLEDDQSFFERERNRLSKDITLGFEELLSSSNVMNRNLEDVLGMTKEYDTIASLWHSFYQLMSKSNVDVTQTPEQIQRGLPGTGGHLVSTRKDGKELP
ncbi:hypothetical protein HGRIS_005821 [Hohenbuehelia grisea]|uniref:DASH complex subunit DAD1 n=1 Tax=Hohenbuehelia grisea TaxID=104357 RepID=A0ABR3K040_9AGAR